MAIVVYAKKDCTQCKMTKRVLDAMRIEYQEVDLDKNPDLLDYIKDELGFAAIPVVITDYDKWSGFRPDRIKEIKKQQLTANVGFFLDKIK